MPQQINLGVMYISAADTFRKLAELVSLGASLLLDSRRRGVLSHRYGVRVADETTQLEGSAGL